MLAVITGVLHLNESQLSIDDQRTDQQNYRNRKLHHHQPLPEPGVADAQHVTALEYLRWGQRREQHRRVDARQNDRQDHAAQQQKPERAVAEIERKVVLGKLVEGG